MRDGTPPGRLFDAYNGVLGGLRDSHLSIVDLSADVQIRGPHLGSCTNAIVSPAVFHPRFASALARQSMLRLGSDVRLRVGRRVEQAIDLGLGLVETVGGVPVEVCRLVRLHGVLQQGESFRQAAMHMRTLVVDCRDQRP